MVARGPNRDLDEVLLRGLARRLGAQTWVGQVDTFPRSKPESVVAELRRAYYPETLVAGVELELRAYTNGDFHLTYREDHQGEYWLCRWDRHENPHNSRDHFHRPPAARTEDAVDRDFPTDLEYVLLDSVFPFLEDRVGDLWKNVGEAEDQ